MDVSRASEPVILPAARILPEAREPLPQQVGPSNRVNAVGQQAKTAVQDARDSGLALPKNAQGYAASRIARGADPESVFSALVADAAPADDGVDSVALPEVDGAVADAPEGAAVAAADDAAGNDGRIAPAEDTGSAEVISLIPGDTAGLSPEEAALDLLGENQVA